VEAAIEGGDEPLSERLKANTLRALGDLDLREARLKEARTNYGLALPIYREIQDRMGEANTLQMLSRSDSIEGAPKKAESGFMAVQHILNEIGNRLGSRSNWGYLGEHYIRNDKAVLALGAYQASLDALPREGDNWGYHISLRGQLTAFEEMQNILGFLACLQLLIGTGDDIKDQYASMMASLKDGIPQDKFDELEHALFDNPDGLRLAAVQQAIEQDGQSKSPEIGETGSDVNPEE